MTAASMVPVVLHTEEIELDDLDPDVDLVALIEQTSKVDLQCAWLWNITSTTDDVPWYQQPALIVGVRDESTGALVWDDDPGFVPAQGSNTAPVDYMLGGAHHTPVDIGAEVPMSVVLDALREYLRTRQPPTCVEWRQILRIGDQT